MRECDRCEMSSESPFFKDELFEREVERNWEPRQFALVARSPFQRAFEPSRAAPGAASEPELDLVQQIAVDDLAMEEAEPEPEVFGDADSEDGPKKAYYEDEAKSVEGEIGEVAAQTRMKFEFQSFDPDKGQGNRIWRNDGRSASPLERKYGPRDFLVDKKGVRLESETNAVLEFETEWFRTWPKLEQALDKAVKMTDAMNNAPSSRFGGSRKAFPFDVAHLRTGSATERARGYWSPDNYVGYENRHWNEGTKEYRLERILGAGEELEIELLDSSWKAGIQSSEGFLLEYYESFLRQHEWPFFRDGAIKKAKAILAAANTDGIPVAQLGKLQSLLQIIVNYVMRGQGGKESEDAGAFADVKGMPSKQAFTLLSRTNFASMYKVLLTEKEQRLFQRFVRDDVVLKAIGLDRKSPVFVKGYGQRHEPGPTVYKWLSGIAAGVDLLSVRSGKGLSAAMGRYNVETRTGKKDRWLVKFETRNSIQGATGIEAKNWAKYASQLFDKARNRERDALDLLLQRGLADESQLTNFVFHARNPDLRGRRIRRGEQALAQQWLRLRSEVVRPALPAVQPELREAYSVGGTMSSEIDSQMSLREGEDEPESSASDPEYKLSVAALEEDTEAPQPLKDPESDHGMLSLARAVATRPVASVPRSHESTAIAEIVDLAGEGPTAESRTAEGPEEGLSEMEPGEELAETWPAGAEPREIEELDSFSVPIEGEPPQEVQQEIILVAGVNYPKFEESASTWKRKRQLSAGPWRDFSLTVAEQRLKSNPKLRVTLFDFLRGTRENVTLGARKKVSTTVENSFPAPIPDDYWNLVGIDWNQPTFEQFLKAALAPANRNSISAKPQVSYFDGAYALSSGTGIKLQDYLGAVGKITSRVISITDLYAYIAGFAGSGRKGTLLELHFFAHAFNVMTNKYSGGPILLNTLDNPSSADRHPLDKDARAGKDFRQPAMDPAVFAQAFSRGARSFVWGCNFQRGFIRQFVHHVGINVRALGAGRPMKISHNADWGLESEFRTRLGLSSGASIRNVSVNLAVVKEVLNDANEKTYMQSLATACGYPVVGAPPGTYSDYDGSATHMKLLHIPMSKDPFRNADGSFERALLFFRDHVGLDFDTSFGDHNGLGRGYIIFKP